MLKVILAWLRLVRQDRERSQMVWVFVNSPRASERGWRLQRRSSPLP